MILDIDNTIIWLYKLVTVKVLELFAVWTVEEERTIGSNLYTILKECAVLKSLFIINKPEQLASILKRHYYMVLDDVNVCLVFIHGILFDQNFAEFASKHDILPTVSATFFFTESDLRNCFFGYVVMQAYGNHAPTEVFSKDQGFKTFEKLCDRFCDVFKFPRLTPALKPNVYNLIFTDLEISPNSLTEEVVRHNIYYFNKFKSDLFLNIYTDYIFKLIDYSKDRADRWNMDAVNYFKTRRSHNIIFFSHLQHFIRTPVAGIAISSEVVKDYNKQKRQKTVVVNDFLSMIDREHETEYSTVSTHSKLHLIPQVMGKLQYLMTATNLIQEYDEIDIYDDRTMALFKWKDINDVDLNIHELSTLFNILIPKLTVHISPTEYALADFSNAFKTLGALDMNFSLIKYLETILKTIIYRDDVYTTGDNLPRKWGLLWNKRTFLQNAILFTGTSYHTDN